MVPLQNDASALVIGSAQITENGLALEVVVNPDALQIPQENETAVDGMIQVQGRFHKVAEQIYFQGRIRGVVTAPCSRCLEMAHADFVIETRVVFLPAASEVSDPENGLRLADDLDLYFHDGVSLDLRPLVREQVVLAFPVQSLCRDDCAGLCQVCGTNRNLERCGCQAREGDPRFAMLQHLRLPETP